MKLHPMIVALRRHKAGVVLITLQIALTLAIVCNAIFIIGQRIQRVNRPTGLDEQNLFLVSSQRFGTPTDGDPASIEKLDSLQRQDLAALRNLPDVTSVTPVSSLPLFNQSSDGTMSAEPGMDARKAADTRFAYYYGDEQMVSTLGLRLLVGRNFNAGDVQSPGGREQPSPATVIVTKALADKRFPHGDAVGKVVYLDGSAVPTTIIGEIARMQTPSTANWGNNFAWNSVLVPSPIIANYSLYAVRAKVGRMQSAMREVTPVLYKVDPLRVLDDDSIKSFSDIRAKEYRADVGMAILMSVICLILLAVTAAGIVGLTSFWVGQRRKQIGVRRALGARKVDILRYFQIENLLIAGTGVAIGVLLARGLNLWLMTRYEMTRMPAWYVLTGVLAMLAMGQAAVFVPARRASNVPPVVATRSV
ncbi:MAG: FtsX-like permease family protein [Rhodanobacter sp.]